MNLSLYQRLSLSLCLMFVAITALFVWWAEQLDEKSRHQAEQQLHIRLAEYLVADNPLLSQGVSDYKALENLFHTQMILGPRFEFYFLDPLGKIVTYSAQPGKVKQEQIELAPLLKLVNHPENLPVYGEDPRSLGEKKIFSVAPVYNQDNLQGYLYVIVGGEVYQSVFTRIDGNQYFSKAVFIGLAALFISLIFLLLIFRYFTAPLKQLSADIQIIKQAGFDRQRAKLTQWNNASHSEVEQLGSEFLGMVDQISEQLLKLKENDKYRKELLTQLSHDLRTPLASIQGYIETIYLKDEQLETQERRKYIETTLKSTRHLRGLIEQIFELAHLESGQVSMDMETFPLGELLYDIAAKFSIAAKRKNITLDVKPENCAFQVYSDIGKLERVLTNLIENALRHTQNGGSVTIKVGQSNAPEKNRLKVIVIDNGSGIASNDLEYIFETRYRGSNAKGGEREHFGLGLAITKKLVELLQSKIYVESELGKGTEFSFELRSAS